MPRERGAKGGHFVPSSLCPPGASSAGCSQDMQRGVGAVIWSGSGGQRGPGWHPHALHPTDHVHILAAGRTWGLGETWTQMAAVMAWFPHSTPASYECSTFMFISDIPSQPTCLLSTQPLSTQAHDAPVLPNSAP